MRPRESSKIRLEWAFRARCRDSGHDWVTGLHSKSRNLERAVKFEQLEAWRDLRYIARTAVRRTENVSDVTGRFELY
jgi:hypothetical protein